MRRSLKILITSFMTIAICLSACLVSIPVGAENNVCSHPKEDGLIWYIGGAVTKAGWLEKGETYDGVIEACNDSTVTQDMNIYTTPYSISQGDYLGPDFYTETSWNKLTEWVSFPNGTNYSIASGQTIYIPFKITVPNNNLVVAGSQAAAIMLENDEIHGNQDETGVLSAKRFSWLVYADINGDGIKRGGQVNSWRASGPLVFDNTKGLSTYSIVENTGNVSYVAQYKLTIMDAFRNNAVAHEDDAEKTILPESRAANEFKWDEAPVVGWFKIREEITVFDETKTFEKMVLIVPLWFIVIVIAILILLIWALILKIKKHREKNKRLNS